MDNVNNQFFVGVRGDDITILKLRTSMTKPEALNLAAWLVVLADPNNEFPALLESVKNQ